MHQHIQQPGASVQRCRQVSQRCPNSLCVFTHFVPADANFLEAALSGQACQVGAWEPCSTCTRTAMNEWSVSRSRPVLQQGAKCPELVESLSCGKMYD
jgi:hypothetical protein